MKSQQQKSSGGFKDTRTTCQRVSSGEIPKWLIDLWVSSTGHSDPRKHYRRMKMVNILCGLVIFSILAVASMGLRSVVLYQDSHRGISFAEVEIFCLCLGVVILGTIFVMNTRSDFLDRVERNTKEFDLMIEHIVRSPRPQFTPTNLVTRRELYRSVQEALIDLAARKIVFLEYERQNAVGLRKLSDFAHSDFGKLFDVGKALGVIDSKETFARYFQLAEIHRVRQVREDFKKMLAGLKGGEEPPLFW